MSKKKDIVKEPVTKKVKQKVKCQLTDAERISVGHEITEHLTEIERLEDDKKRTVADFTAKITSEESLLGVARNKFTTGYEYRELECLATMDDPIKGRKTVRRVDNNESVEVADMSYDEKNPPLPLEDKPKAPEPGAPLNPVAAAMPGNED